MILARRLDDLPPPVDGGPISFRVATPADLDRLPPSQFGDRRDRHRQYVLADQDVLFIAEHGTEVVATLRYSRMLPTALRDGHGIVAKIVALTSQQVWGADAFCVREYRNRGISRQLLFFALRWLGNQGYTEAFGTVATTNIPSLRMSLNVGSRILCYVSYVRLLSYTRIRVSRRLPHRLETRLKWMLDVTAGANGGLDGRTSTHGRSTEVPD